jgi:hypothetical protein
MPDVRILDALTGEPVTVDDAEASAGLAQGRYRAGGPVAVRLRSGQVADFDDSDAAARFLATSPDAVGIDTPEHERERALQREFGDSPIRAGVEGAARGATLGLSDVAARAIGGEDVAAGMREREQRNEGAAMLGEVAGSVAPLLIPGAQAGAAARGAGVAGRILRGATAPVRGLARVAEGAGAAVARGVAGAEAGTARRILARGVGTAVEGGIEGAAASLARPLITEQALGYEPDLSADAIAMRVGMGTVLGAGLGGVLGVGMAGIGEGLGGAARMAGSLADRASLIRRGWSDTVGTELRPEVASAVGMLTEAAERATPAQRVELQVALQAGDMNAPIVQRMMAATPDGARVREIVTSGRAREEATRALRGVVDEVLGAEQQVAEYARGSLRRDAVRRRVTADNFAEQAAYAQQVLTNAQQLASRLQSGDGGIFQAGGIARGRDLGRYLAQIGETVDFAIERGGIEGAADLAITLDALKRRIGGFQRDIRKTDQEGARALQAAYMDMIAPLEDARLWGEGFATMQREFNAGWTNMLARLNQFEGRFATEGGRMASDPWRNEVIADPAKIQAFLDSAGTARNDLNDEVFDEVLAAMADFNRRVADFGDVPAELAARARATPQAVERARALVRSAREDAAIGNQWREYIALQGGARGITGVIGGFIDGGAAGAMAGAFGPTQTARALSWVQQAARRTDERLTTGVRRFLRQGGEVARDVGARGRRGAVMGSVKAYTERTRRLEEERAGLQERLAERTRALADAPRVQQALQGRAVAAVGFLEARRPAGRALAGDLLAGRTPRPPSRPEMARFLRYARAVDDPESILRDFEQGRVTREGVEVLREVYPALYQQLVRTVMRELQAQKAPPPYQARIQLGALLGVATDPSLTPEFLATVQATHAAAEAAQPQESSAAQGQAPDLAGAAASQMDSLVARRGTA